ncbi:hypothetical protein BJ170DRAFT_680596 [Xylariales sp. AK1849]|nr:hypothetical protein BJ170DRAFT_680596 [Xylariales sp. AK1849]
MSWNRFSLPSRATPLNKFQEDGPSKLPKFPTVNVAKGFSRRRPNLSSAFASLWDKDQNHGDEFPSLTTSTSDERPIVRHRENVKPSADVKNGHIPELQETAPMSTDAIPVQGTFNLPVIDQTFIRVDAPYFPDYRGLAELPGTPVPSSEEYPAKPISSKPDLDLNRVHSASSSYPSEGIRSEAHDSPIGSFGTRRDITLSNISQYLPGHVVTRASRSWLRSTSMTNGSAPRNVSTTLQEELAAADMTSYEASSTTTDIHHVDSKITMSVQPVDRTSPKGWEFVHEAEPTDLAETVGTAREKEKQAMPNRADDSGDYTDVVTAHRVSNVDSTVGLQPTPEVRHRTLVRHVRKIKLKRWAKKVGYKTKVRFQKLQRQPRWKSLKFYKSRLGKFWLVSKTDIAG